MVPFFAVLTSLCFKVHILAALTLDTSWSIVVAIMAVVTSVSFFHPIIRPLASDAAIACIIGELIWANAFFCLLIIYFRFNTTGERIFLTFSCIEVKVGSLRAARALTFFNWEILLLRALSTRLCCGVPVIWKITAHALFSVKVRQVISTGTTMCVLIIGLANERTSLVINAWIGGEVEELSFRTFYASA